MHYIIIFLGLLIIPIPSFANMTTREERQSAELKLKNFDHQLSNSDRYILKNTDWDKTNSLTPRLRDRFIERNLLKDDVHYWKDVEKFEADLLKLSLSEGVKTNPTLRSQEAQKIAEEIIKGFHDLRKKYKMLRPAIFQNFLVNVKIKEEGFCWHWARDLTKRLIKLHLKEFDLHWAIAHEGKLREHNTLVISSKEMPLEEGLLVDGWRHSGEPFWVLVKNDHHYPWKPGKYEGDDLYE
jgi:hypothetical protein